MAIAQHIHSVLVTRVWFTRVKAKHFGKILLPKTFLVKVFIHGAICNFTILKAETEKEAKIKYIICP